MQAQYNLNYRRGNLAISSNHKQSVFKPLLDK